MLAGGDDGGDGEGCFTGDTAVLMHDGALKPIKDTHIGDLVLAQHNGCITPCKVNYCTLFECIQYVFYNVPALVR